MAFGCGPSQVTLIDLGVYGTADVKMQLEVIYEELCFYCSRESLQLHMMGLTRTLVGYGSSADYPTGTLESIIESNFFDS